MLSDFKNTLCITPFKGLRLQSFSAVTLNQRQGVKCTASLPYVGPRRR